MHGGVMCAFTIQDYQVFNIIQIFLLSPRLALGNLTDLFGQIN